MAFLFIFAHFPALNYHQRRHLQTSSLQSLLPRSQPGLLLVEKRWTKRQVHLRRVTGWAFCIFLSVVVSGLPKEDKQLRRKTKLLVELFVHFKSQITSRRSASLGILSVCQSEVSRISCLFGKGCDIDGTNEGYDLWWPTAGSLAGASLLKQY